MSGREELDEPARAVAASYCPECGRVLQPVGSQAADETRCGECFDLYLRSVDAEFLDNYGRTGARTRIVTAEACLRSLVLSDTADRKLLAMTIYEQFIDATVDLVALYHALLHRRTAPIVKSLLGPRLAPPDAVRFFRMLTSSGPTDLLATLGLPHPDQLPSPRVALDQREWKQVRSALRDALVDLERLTAYVSVGQQALVSASRRVHAPATLADRTGWIAGRQLLPGEIASVALNAADRRIEVDLLNTEEETLGLVVDGVQIMTRLIRNLIFAFVSLHGADQFLSGFAQG